MTYIPPCPQNWETCETCGARPEEGCLDPDVATRVQEETMGYKGAFIPKDEKKYTYFNVVSGRSITRNPGETIPGKPEDWIRISEEELPEKTRDDDSVPASNGEGGAAVSPEHYSRHAIEPIDFIEMNNLGFSVGNAIKYLVRYDAKNGLEDLYKAKRYVEFLIQKECGLSPSSAAD